MKINNILYFNGKSLSLDEPKIMGILNVSPESFYQSIEAQSDTSVLEKINQMVLDGMDILDIGAMTSKPGATLLSVEEEWNRLSRILPLIRSNFPNLPISLDAFRTEIVRRGIDQGIDMLNDITAGYYDDSLLPFMSNQKIPYLMMHMRGLPSTMQDPKNLEYDDVMIEIVQYFKRHIDRLSSLNFNQVLIDPGFGFGKTIYQNYQILKNLSVLKVLEKPMVVGLSRKSMIYKLWKGEAADALFGTIGAEMIALLNGANILRVHDVKETKQLINVFLQYSVI